MLIGIPSLVVAVCIVALLTMCYPRAVFLWGDEVNRYADLLLLRGRLWNVIITVLVGGIASKLLYDGISMFFISRK